MPSGFEQSTLYPGVPPGTVLGLVLDDASSPPDRRVQPRWLRMAPAPPRLQAVVSRGAPAVRSGHGCATSRQCIVCFYVSVSSGGKSRLGKHRSAEQQTPGTWDFWWPKRGVTSLLQGASPRAATHASLQPHTITTREPSRSCRGEGHVRAPQSGCTCTRSRRGRGRSTWTRSRTDHTRGPSARPSRGRRARKADGESESCAAASEGIVERRAPRRERGRSEGPCGGHVGGEHAQGHDRGPFNHPGGPPSIDHVRQRDADLGVAAKRSPERRFNARGIDLES